MHRCAPAAVGSFTAARSARWQIGRRGTKKSAKWQATTRDSYTHLRICGGKVPNWFVFGLTLDLWLFGSYLDRYGWCRARKGVFLCRIVVFLLGAGGLQLWKVRAGYYACYEVGYYIWHFLGWM